MTTRAATTKKKPATSKRDSRPAPDAGWPMLPDRRPRPLRRPVEPVPAPEPAPAEEQDVVAVLVEIAFSLDGQPTGIVARMQTVMPRPSAGQDAMRLQIGLDARQTMQALEPLVGPSRGSSIVTPGHPGFVLPDRQ